MRRLLAVVLIMAGLGLLAFPKARECYFDYRQRQLLEAWAKRATEAATTVGPEKIPEVNAEPGTNTDRRNTAMQSYILENMIGILQIPSIDLILPVLKRDSAADLDISAAQVAGSAGPGETGNFIIAGHRQLTYGRHFNRLHEVKTGDLIEFTGPGETFIYRVFDTKIIQPEDTTVLEPSEEKLITLVTCHGTRRPFTRFVVQGRLLEDTFNPGTVLDQNSGI